MDRYCIYSVEHDNKCAPFTFQVVFPLQKEKVHNDDLGMDRIYGICQLHTATGQFAEICNVFCKDSFILALCCFTALYSDCRMAVMLHRNKV